MANIIVLGERLSINPHKERSGKLYYGGSLAGVSRYHPNVQSQNSDLALKERYERVKIAALATIVSAGLMFISQMGAKAVADNSKLYWILRNTSDKSFVVVIGSSLASLVCLHLPIKSSSYEGMNQEKIACFASGMFFACYVAEGIVAGLNRQHCYC